MTTIERVLVANRGEIAIRITRTLQRLGKSVVAVCSEADVDAPHVRAADRAVIVGAAAPALSYLNVDAVLAAAQRTGVQAIHPGYGFLSENAAAAQRCIDAGLVWIGPTPEQIERLGDKITAKRLALELGVPSAPFHVLTQDAPLPDLDYPVLVKAAAGGGGRGMRVVHRAEDLPSAVSTARTEAQRSFGDPTVFVEPYLDNGRHVEVQIMGDQHGNVVHLGDRDCSIQRRNQKVIEEAPAPHLDEEVRAAITSGAVQLAQAVGYVGVGTVEFLIDGDGSTNFLEVNTRLQVEHPVTEAITGLDLVEWQVRVAEGEALPFNQEQITLRGHAIELRVVAEDPSAGWLPDTGIVEWWRPAPGIRVDSGIGVGSVISEHYDSLLAKLIVHADHREAALTLARRAVRTTEIAGLRTNLMQLDATIGHRGFREGTVSTRFFEDHPECLTPVISEEERDRQAVAAALHWCLRDRKEDAVTGFAPFGWRNLRVAGVRMAVADHQGTVAIEVIPESDCWRVKVGDPPDLDETGALLEDRRAVHRVSVQPSAADTLAFRYDDEVVVARVVALSADRVLCARADVGCSTWTRLPRFVDPEFDQVGKGPVAPLPGSITAVHVAVGEMVERGTPLVVMEAMKMEHTVVAPFPARVSEVHVATGDRVDAGVVLVTLEQQ